MNIQLLYKAIRTGEALNHSHLLHLRTNLKIYTKPQLASLAIALLLQKRSDSIGQSLIKAILSEYPDLQNYLNILLTADKVLNDTTLAKDIFTQILAKTNTNKELSDAEIEFLFHHYQQGKIDDTSMAVWLMTASYKELTRNNIVKIAYLCRDSGQIFDYRNLAALEHRKLIRRYPTGALSEKIALIMPSLICAFADRYPIMSNFLVAKSLGYTGGTWDKLNVIPGFTFPKQGEETIQTMQACHVAISVTVDQFNPLDEKLYQLRSATGSVESISLIAISIASKLLAIPGDFLLMDVRFGGGAFAKSLEEAKILIDDLDYILRPNMDVDFLMTEMNQPNGMSIGNPVELIEAITIIKNDLDNPNWDRRALEEQRALVCKMFAVIMHHVFPETPIESFMTEINDAFEKNMVLNGFNKLLKAHGVSEQTIKALIDDPESLVENYVRFIYQAPTSGTLKYIDQKSLGLLANFELSTGLNKLVPKKENGAGIILKVRLGDFVETGQTLCEVVATEEYILQNLHVVKSHLSDSFTIAKD